MAVQKQQSTKRLVLSRSGNVSLPCQGRENGCNVFSAHFVGVSSVVEEDIPSSPAQVGWLRSIGIMLQSDGVSNLVKQLFGAGVQGQCKDVKLEHMY
ncbi:hypothetical protein JVX88_12155 [Leptolyngbya sp. 7M]|nr:hypothetical protein JVX88_12155 [Leptolyngbya sp. 7M]